MEVDPEQLRRVDFAKQWVCDRIREIRLARGYSQEQLGSKMGIHRSRVCDFEKGISDYKMSTVMRAAYALGVTMDRIFQGFPGWQPRRALPAKLPELVIVEKPKLESELLRAGLTRSQISEVIARISPVSVQ